MQITDHGAKDDAKQCWVSIPQGYDEVVVANEGLRSELSRTMSMKRVGMVKLYLRTAVKLVKRP